jgi:ubiquinone biosynthesis protein COQ9
MEATEQVRVRSIIFCEPTIDVYLHFAPRVAVFFRANMPILTNIFQLFPILTCVRCIPRQAVVAPLRISTRSVSGVDSADGNSFDGQRTRILSAALDKVHEFGWTDDAIAGGVVALNLPPSTMGLVTGGPSELVAFFMDQCNRRLEKELKERFIPSWEEQRTPVPERIHQAIWCRLEMVGPYIRSGRWQDGMALGAMPPNNTLTTAGQLSHLVDTITSAVGLPSVGVVEKTAIGGVYATTELHMLADDSPAFEQTAVFLEHRVRELETMAGVASSMGSGGPGLLSPTSSARGRVHRGKSSHATTLLFHVGTDRRRKRRQLCEPHKISRDKRN